MAIEEKVIQPESVTNAEQPVAETASQPQAPDLTAVKAEYESQLNALPVNKLQKNKKNLKVQKIKLDEVYKKKEEQKNKN